MFNRKKIIKLNTIIKEKDDVLARYAARVKDVEFFANLGVKTAQARLNGYKLIWYAPFQSNTSTPIAWFCVRKALASTEGSTEDKLLAAFKEADRIVRSSVLETFDKKDLLSRLKRVTKVSEFTGDLI